MTRHISQPGADFLLAGLPFSDGFNLNIEAKQDIPEFLTKPFIDTSYHFGHRLR